ncbi:MAG: hypothetical protein H6704_21680 [Myxococcales bacterium]|nr:hypothetical protein [Myxococcales bacterium]MCB9538853.1 hypothetical protein [Myxococcales bacterium]
MTVPHIYRWDLDKTYLQTDFDSLGALLRTAFQRPADKTNVPGSAELLRALRVESAGRALIYFVSGSPKQMRGVLSEKLRLDGIHFDGFILKDNLGNLLKGRFRALREQVGYKLPALLAARRHAPVEARETLFGDDAERDAFTYSLYADLLARRVEPEVLEQVLDLAGVYPDGREAIYESLGELAECDPVERIIIHLDRKSPPIRFEAYGPRVVPVYNYFQAALVLFQDGRLRAEAVGRLGTALRSHYDFSLNMLLRSFQDILRRGALTYDAARRLGAQAVDTGIDPAVVELFAAEARNASVVTPAERPQRVPDYPALLKREQQRHAIEKARRKRRRRWL